MLETLLLSEGVLVTVAVLPSGKVELFMLKLATEPSVRVLVQAIEAWGRPSAKQVNKS